MEIEKSVPGGHIHAHVARWKGAALRGPFASSTPVEPVNNSFTEMLVGTRRQCVYSSLLIQSHVNAAIKTHNFLLSMPQDTDNGRPLRELTMAGHCLTSIHVLHLRKLTLLLLPLRPPRSSLVSPRTAFPYFAADPRRVGSAL